MSSSFRNFDLGWWRKMNFSVKSSQCPMGPFGDNFGLRFVGLVPLGLLPIGLMSVGLKSLILKTVGPKPVGLKCLGLKPVGLLPWPWDLEVSP